MPKGIRRSEFLAATAGILLGTGAAESPAQQKASGRTNRRALGKTGIEASGITLGAGEITDSAILQLGLDRGVNAIDTARRYQNGRNEEMVGKVVSGIRKEVIISSKLRPYGMESRKALDRSLEESLRALRTDYLDILYIHDARTTDEVNSDIMREFFTAAKKSGKIRACGFTSHENQLEMIRNAVGERFYDVLMIPYNHAGMFVHRRYGFRNAWNQAAMEEEFRKAARAGIGLVAMKTCSGGPYKPAGEKEASYRAALEWVLKNPNIQSASVAMGNFEEAEENLSVLKGK